VIKTNTETENAGLAQGEVILPKSNGKKMNESQLMFNILAGISDPMSTSLSIKIS
jgi:vancomycin resistance protein YoaR